MVGLVVGWFFCRICNVRERKLFGGWYWFFSFLRDRFSFKIETFIRKVWDWNSFYYRKFFF